MVGPEQMCSEESEHLPARKSWGKCIQRYAMILYNSVGLRLCHLPQILGHSLIDSTETLENEGDQWKTIRNRNEDGRVQIQSSVPCFAAFRRRSRELGK